MSSLYSGTPALSSFFPTPLRRVQGITLFPVPDIKGLIDAVWGYWDEKPFSNLPGTQVLSEMNPLHPSRELRTQTCYCFLMVSVGQFGAALGGTHVSQVTGSGAIKSRGSRALAFVVLFARNLSSSPVYRWEDHTVAQVAGSEPFSSGTVPSEVTLEGLACMLRGDGPDPQVATRSRQESTCRKARE